MNRIVLFCTTLFLSIGLYAQSGPNCRPINASLDADGYTYFELQEFVTNAVAGPGCEVTITNSFGGIVFGPEQLNPGDAVVFNACAYLSQTLKINVSNPSGACWSYLTFKQSNGPVLMGRSKDVYCFDSLILGGHIDDEPPLAFVPCVQEFDAAFVADWVQVYECGAPGDPVNDTVKVIYREYEAYDKHGNRGFTFDTITVFRLPYIDVVEVPNAYCAEKDTTYCGEGNPGPYMVYPERCIPANFGMDQDGDGSPCDTIYFLLYDDSLGRYVLNPFLNDTKCGLLTHLDYWSFGNNGCEENSKYVLEIKQTCVPPFDFTCGIDASLIPSNALREIAPGYFECEFWVVDLDTVAPIALCKAKADPSLAIISTSTHECAAHTYLPDVWVTDDWSGVKQVKATIEGIGSFIFTQNEDGSFSSHTQVKLPKNDDGYAIIYEAYDSCHNIGTDTCYLYVKDRVRPVPVADKGVTVSLSDKKVWVDAASFDEGSWDNCGVNLLLARRSDWYEACIDLCDSVEYCWISEHHDTIWQAFLEPDKRKDPIEAHYAKVLQWLWEDEEPCSELLYNAWIYDLLKYGTIECTPGHYVDEHYFDELIKKVLLDQIETEKGSIVDKFKCENGLDGLSPGDILFLGTDQNDGTSLNDAFALNVDDLSTAALFSGFSVRGMAADETNNRLLISGSDANGSSNGADGSLLYSWSIDGKKDPIFLGYITVQGNRANAEGLAMINGKLYAYIDNIQNIADVDGIYEIDLQKLSATLVVPEGDFDDLDGLDGDGETGLLYGSSDGEDEIAVIDLSAGTINTLAPYPSGVTDVDGLAVGGGIIYLIQDDSAGTIHLYDIALGTYTGTIEAPFDVDDNRAGGATLFGRGICGYSKSQLAAKIDEWRAIGGGWAEEVPFSCEDACGPVIVELLVMDYWCNWGTVWTTVWVEDKTPVQVVKDVVEEETISCKTYKENRYSYPGELHPVSLEYIVEVGKTGDSTALAQLDAILGGYCKAWVDPYGNYVDEDGVEIECDIPFEDSQCYCKDTTSRMRVYDEHLGYIWKDSTYRVCYYDDYDYTFQKGIVAVNCAENVYCEQTVWCDIDHCGEGYIFRKFKIWQSCPPHFYSDPETPDSLKHPVDTIYRHQKIRIGNFCPLDKGMFDVPADMEVFTCDIQYGEDANVIGDAGPENTGYATYKFDDDCRLVGIGHSDKVFKIVGGDAACYKIIRTWYFADWCGGQPVDDDWWTDGEFPTISCEQKIIVRDTTLPVCLITGPVDNGGQIEVGACYYNLVAAVDVSDACGVSNYYWEVKDIKDESDPVVVDSGDGALNSDTSDAFTITSDDLADGLYKLVVVVEDECNNEGTCEYFFEVVSIKKPAAVCVTFLTARLNPMDLDQDGEVDTAMVVVWAEEFNSSSDVACDDDYLEYRIELLDQVDDSTYVEDTSYIELGCDHFGTHLVRMWVISQPSGTVDFCDVILTVQSDFSGCLGNQSGEKGQIGSVTDMHDESKDPYKEMMGKKEVAIAGDAGTLSYQVNGYRLEQNRPNPFRTETRIGFVLAESGTATITVYDLTGRVMRSVEGDFSKGYNEIKLKKDGMGTSGILYYRLEARDFTETRKMIMIRS